MLFLKLWWKPLAGVAAVLVLLMWYRTQIQKAEARGWERATIEATIAAAEAARAYQAQVDAAETRLAASRDARRKAVATAKDEARAYYQANPDAAGTVCLSPDRVRVQNEARSRIHSSATSGGRDRM
jgi:hypothetical protein